MQLKRARRRAGAQQVQNADAPAHFRRRKLEQYRLGHQKRRSDAERNNVRQRIELPSKRAVLPAHTRNPAVKQIEQTSRENQERGVLITGKGRHGIAVRLVDPFKNRQNGEKSATPGSLP